MYVKFLDSRPLANEALEKEQVRDFWAVSGFMLQLWFLWYFAALASCFETFQTKLSRIFFNFCKQEFKEDTKDERHLSEYLTKPARQLSEYVLYLKVRVDMSEQ